MIEELRRDQRLRTACDEFVRAFIDRLERIRVWPRPAGIPWPRIGHDYVWPDIQELPELVAAENQLARHRFLLPMYADQRHSYGPREFRHILQPFAERVAAYVAAGNTFEAAFDRWYRVLLADLAKPTVIVLRMHEITALNSQLQRIPLDATSSLERFGGYLTTRLLKLDFQAPVDSLSLGFNSGWALVSRYRVKKTGSASRWRPPAWDDQNRLSALLSALRLLHSGAYAEGSDVQAHLSQLPVEDVMVYKESLLPTEAAAEEIQPQDVLAIRRLFKHLLRVGAFAPGRQTLLPRPLSTALFHFNKSFDDMAGWTEQIMDCVIALEVLLGVTTEQSYRLASRVALLIGRDDGEIRTILSQVKAMYRVRSIPAHGKEIDEKEWQRFYRLMTGRNIPKVDPHQYRDDIALISAAVEEARDILRRVILACLRLQEVPNKDFTWPFRDDLEEVLFTSTRKRLQRLARVHAGITF